MGLRSDIKEAVRDAFDDDLADAVNTFTIRSSNRSFDPASGSLSKGVDYVTGSWRGVFDKFDRKLVNNSNIKFADVTVISLENEKPFEPQIGFLIDKNGHEYHVVGIEKDPADSMYFMFCVNSNYG